MGNEDAKILGEKEKSPSVGLTSGVLPEAQSHVSAMSSTTGVSTKNTLPKTSFPHQNSSLQAHWYALRTTYGRERKAYDYLTAKGVTAYLPTILVEKDVKGKRITTKESRLPNIFFAHGTEKEMKKYVYDNYNLPFLRFYYRHTHEGNHIEKEPLIVPDRQMESLKIICESEAEDVIVVPEEVQKFKTGQMVRITEGKFKGVVGRVARYQGQQRVAVIIDGVLTMATAYLPTAFLEYIE